MNRNQMLLADMLEKKSKYGNTYFEGSYEQGGKIIMRKTKEGQRYIWKLFWVKKGS